MSDMVFCGCYLQICYEMLDVIDCGQLCEIIECYGIMQIYYLVVVLLVVVEQLFMWGWVFNMNGLLNVLEVVCNYQFECIFWFSLIVVFGLIMFVDNILQSMIMELKIVYGIFKLVGEGWCCWYFEYYGVDVCSLCYLGLILYKIVLGGGMIDYVIDIFYLVVKGECYMCFLEYDEVFFMMYMLDVVCVIIELMEVLVECISQCGSYNLVGVSFMFEQLVVEICWYCLLFEVVYVLDFCQVIVVSWLNFIDDLVVWCDWGWKFEYGVVEMMIDMLQNFVYLVVYLVQVVLVRGIVGIVGCCFVFCFDWLCLIMQYGYYFLFLLYVLFDI